MARPPSPRGDWQRGGRPRSAWNGWTTPSGTHGWGSSRQCWWWPGWPSERDGSGRHGWPSRRCSSWGSRSTTSGWRSDSTGRSAPSASTRRVSRGWKGAGWGRAPPGSGSWTRTIPTRPTWTSLGAARCSSSSAGPKPAPVRTCWPPGCVSRRPRRRGLPGRRRSIDLRPRLDLREDLPRSAKRSGGSGSCGPGGVGRGAAILPGPGLRLAAALLAAAASPPWPAGGSGRAVAVRVLVLAGRGFAGNVAGPCGPGPALGGTPRARPRAPGRPPRAAGARAVRRRRARGDSRAALQTRRPAASPPRSPACSA